MWLDRIIAWVFPTIALEGTPWLQLWQANQRRDFIVRARLLYLIVGLAYVGHYLFFDRVMKLEPIEFWFQFRMSMLLLAWVTAGFYFVPALYGLRYYKLPAMIAGAVFCYFQARVLVWYEGSLYFYAFAFVIVATVALSFSIVQSIAYAALLIGSQWHSYLEANIGTPLLFSATAITLIFIVFARTGYAAEVKYFKANQQNIENQRRIIELNIEFADRIRAFLPKEISSRLFRYVEEKRMTILQAIEEVLRPRQRDIACLFSDIRGFTRATQGKGEVFLDEGVIPNVKQCTYVVEGCGGIPRKIGDLLFAYFDQPDPRDNLARCLKAAIDVIQANNDFNEGRPGQDPINRYVLITSGEAVVGNLGGFDSSIEITALGNPVNFLSRIDEATKHPAIRQFITNRHVVMDERTAVELTNILDDFKPECLNLAEHGVRIRDFESVDRIFLYLVDPLKTRTTNTQLRGLVRSDVRPSHDADQQIQAIRARS
jgi:class 3 adenylate cyclase